LTQRTEAQLAINRKWEIENPHNGYGLTVATNLSNGIAQKCRTQAVTSIWIEEPAESYGPDCILVRPEWHFFTGVNITPMPSARPHF